MRVSRFDRTETDRSRGPSTGSGPRTPSRGFTLIELMTVIAIIMLVMALALPNFMEMVRQRRWQQSIATLQGLIMRARALATNERKDIAVEFQVRGTDGTSMWLESEQPVLERIPDLDVLQHQLGGGGAIYWIRSIWHDAGGTDKWCWYEWKCNLCGREWEGSDANRRAPCPGCGESEWPYYPSQHGYYYDFQFTGNPVDVRWGDNARQSEEVDLGRQMTIDLAPGRTVNFINWDSRESVECYGWDETLDIRIGPNGALVQTLDPILCIREREGEEYQRVQVVRCTGRLNNPD